jgi:hypothetical protein
MTALLDLIDSLIGRVIYVWGANGEIVYLQTVNGKIDPEGWIKSKEASTANANRAIKLYRTLLADKVFPVYAMDCSALVCFILKTFGLIKPTADYNTKGLYAMCNSHPTREELRQGDLVFHARKPGDASTIHHVGIYLGDGTVAECRGRDFGGVVTEFDDHPADWSDSWNMFGRLNKLAPYTEEYAPVTEYPDKPLSLAVCKPASEGDGYEVMQRALNLLGYKDADGKVLDEDGVWGKRSDQAWRGAVANNIGTIALDGSLHIEGIGDIKLTLKEE